MCLTKESLHKLFINENNNNQPVLGGNGIVIIIDLLHFHTNVQPYNKFLVGMAELKEIPMRSAFEYTEHEKNIDPTVFVAIIKKMVAPGSWLVFEDKVFVNEYYKMLNDCYPVVMIRSKLEEFNTNQQNVLDNLTIVWNHALKSLL